MNRVLSGTTNSGPSVGASSLVTDANSGLSGGTHLQRSASVNAESYMRLPASPISFSSNNLSISGSSVLDSSSIVQQSSHQDHGSQSLMQRHPSQQQQQQKHGASSVTSQPSGPNGQPLTTGSQIQTSLNQDQCNLFAMQKKPRLDIRQEDIMQQQMIQQLRQWQDPSQLQTHNPHVQALILQQRQQLLQAMPQLQRPQMQQPQQQFRHQIHQGVHPPAVKRPYDSGICSRRLMQYIYHQRHRPPDNNILYWRKFVAEYFAPRAKKRWCLSLYENVGHHALGVFPQTTTDAWHCDICGSKSGRGFETTCEVLPRLTKIKFDSGVTDELLFVDLPHEYRFASGVMVLEYGRAVQESIYEQLRVVREGKLRIIFTPDLKILSWEFCARNHEEFLPRRLIAPQVNQLLQVAQKYQNSVSEAGSAGVSVQDLQTSCNMFVAAGRQLVRSLDLQSLNDLGFSKRYVRCLQIAEVVNSMKDLIDFTRERNVGPIESLKNYTRQGSQTKLQTQRMQEMEQMMNAQSMHSDSSSLKAMSHPLIGKNQAAAGAANNMQATMSLNNYQNLLRQNSMNSNSSNGLDASINNPGHVQPLSYQSSPSISCTAMQNGPANAFQVSHSSQNIMKQNQSSSSGQHLNQHMIQQLLQEMMNNNNGIVVPHSGAGSTSEDAFGGAGTTLLGRASSGGGAPGNNISGMTGNNPALVMSRSNSFKAVSNSSPTVSGSSFNVKQDTPQNLSIADLVPDMPRDFSENMFNDDAFGWK